MKTITIEKIHKWWYVIVRDEEGRNVTMANFTTKREATACRDHWVEWMGYKAV